MSTACSDDETSRRSSPVSATHETDATASEAGSPSLAEHVDAHVRTPRSVDFQSLQDYEYAPLANPEWDVRVVEILPGEFDDDIHVNISHTTLTYTPGKSSMREVLSVEELMKTVPEGWKVRKSIFNRIMFLRPDLLFQWQHPVEGFPRDQYDITLPLASPNVAYEALSYAWGPNVKTGFIVVQDSSTRQQLPFKRLAVTSNLFFALKHLRQLRGSRAMWIDAICINQDDDVEKAKQVHRMGDIFRQAYRLVVWLGPEADDSDTAMTTLSDFGSYIGISTSGEGFARYDTSTQVLDALKPNSFPAFFGPEAMASAGALLSRPWFKRRWVVQEVCLSKTWPMALVQCGASAVLMEHMHAALIFLRAVAVQAPDQARQALPFLVGPAISRIDPTTASRTTLNLILSLGYLECSDRRDEIFSILGILPPLFGASISPSYECSVSGIDVERAAFLTHLEHTRRLELMLNCRYQARQTTPSWVPSWGKHAFSGTTAFFELVGQFSGCNGRAVWKYSPGGSGHERLGVIGIAAGRITAVEGAFHGDYDMCRDQVLALWERHEAVSSTSKSSMARTLSMDLTERDRLRGCWARPCLSTVEATLSRCTQASLPDPTDSADANLMVRISGFCAHKSLVSTALGSVGVAPPTAKVGDVIVVLLGCPAPMILRQTEREGQWLVVGHCYMWEASDGKTLLGELPHPWEVVFATSPSNYYIEIRYFFNPTTGEQTREDPRLPPLEGWERIDRQKTRDDPLDCDFFRNLETGEVINYDPRLDPEPLEARGVKVETFTLV